MLSKSELDVEVVKSNHIQEYEEKASLQSNFDLEIKHVSDVKTLVVEETESQKETPLEVKPILEFVNVMPKEIPHGLPPMRDIQHQVDLIPSLVFPNKIASIISLKDHENFKILYVLTMLVHEKDGSWIMCFDCQTFNNFFIHEEVRFNIG